MDYMPFGKFYGSPIADLPDGYLAWLLTIELSDRLREAVEWEADARAHATAGSRRPWRAPRGCAPAPAVVDELVSAGLRTLARKHHPDVGGDPRRMRDFNTAADWLKQSARALA